MIAAAITDNASVGISATGLVKHYGDIVAVDGLDLDVPAG